MQTTTLTTQPVSRLFFHYLVPSICGTMVTSIYVLADTIIIGKGIGAEAMAALNIVLPIFSLFFGTGLLFGVGGSVLMSISRGRGRPEDGHRYFTSALLLNGISCIFYMLIFGFFMEEIARFLGATDVTMPYIMQYIPYVIWGMGAFFFSTFLQTFVRNDGAPKLSMVAVVSGGIFNVIFDFIFVFPMQMGMAGASIASVLGSLLTVLILLTHFRSKENGIRLRMKGIRASHFANVYKNGFVSFLIEMSSGIVIFVFNIQLLRYVGDIAITVYGVITNTVIVVNCLCNGISQAAQPIVSTNYGANLLSRSRRVRTLGIRTALCICALPALLGVIVPNLFTYIFLNPTPEILDLSSNAIRIYFTAFVATGVNMFTIGYFQSTVRAAQSLLLCLMRGCLLSILFVFILPPFLGVNGIWLSVPLAELITLLAGILFIRRMDTSPLPAAD